MSTDTRNLQTLGQFVSQRIGALQAQYLAGSSTARGQLAQLRHAVGKPVGAVPAVWDITLSDVPGIENWTAETPTRNELASHFAMTLYSIHQQSRSERMHQWGWGLGRSVRALTDRAQSDEAVRRRFEVLGTSESIHEVATHARGLISQLRAAGIPLDYGLFADQLVSIQFPDGLNRVRLQWGRDFYRYPVDQDSQETSK